MPIGDATEALAYLADPENWLGDPHDQRSTLHGHFTPFELARQALGSEQRSAPMVSADPVPGGPLQSDFRVVVRAATRQEREGVVERQHGAPIASDACVLVFVAGRTIGWGDDYGTFHLLPSPSSSGAIEEAGELLLEAALSFWDAERRL